MPCVTCNTFNMTWGSCAWMIFSVPIIFYYAGVSSFALRSKCPFSLPLTLRICCTFLCLCEGFLVLLLRFCREKSP